MFADDGFVDIDVGDPVDMFNGAARGAHTRAIDVHGYPVGAVQR